MYQKINDNDIYENIIKIVEHNFKYIRYSLSEISNTFANICAIVDKINKRNNLVKGYNLEEQKGNVMHHGSESSK